MQDVSVPIANSQTKEEVIADVAPTFAPTVKEIEEDPNTTPVGKEIAIKEQEEELLKSVQAKIKELEKTVKKNPEDQEAKGTLETLQEVESATETSIAERTKTIETLQEVSAPFANISLAKEDVIEDIDLNYLDARTEIEESDKSPFKKKLRTATLEAGLLEQLIKEKGVLEKEIGKNLEDEEATTRLSIVEQMIIEQESIIDEIRAEGLESITAEDKEAFIKDADPSYFEEIQIAETPEEIIEREIELQEALRKEINAREKVQLRKFSVRVDLELSSYRKLLEESNKREDEAGSGAPVVNTVPERKDTFVKNLRGTLLDGNPEELAAERTTKEELEQQIAVLNNYEEAIDMLIGEVEVEIEKELTSELEEEFIWLKEEKEAVVKKRRRAMVSIGELETNVIASNPNITSEDPELGTLQEEEMTITAGSEEDLPQGERNKLTKELEAVQTRQEERENELLKESIRKDQDHGEKLIKEVTSLGSEKAVFAKVNDHYEREDQEIETLVKSADSADSEAEKNYLLKEAKRKRDELNKEVQEVIVEEQINAIEEAKGISLSTPQELIAKKRRFTFSIGEITREIAKVDKEIETAKKRGIPELEAKRETLVAEKELMESRLDSIDKKIGESAVTESVVSKQAMEQPITFNEERKISGSEEYEKYHPVAVEALKIEIEMRNLDGILEREGAAIQRMIIEEADQGEIDIKADKIKGLEEERTRMELELTQKKYMAEQALPENTEEAMKMQNLVARGITPLKTADKKIGESAVTESVVSKQAMEQPITFNEERKISGSEEYEKYHPVAVEALKIEIEMRNLDGILEREGAAIQRMIIEEADQGEIDIKADKIKGLEEERTRMELELTQKKYMAEQALPENTEEAMKMQNLVARGITPLKTAVVATALFNLPTTGLAIDPEGTNANNGSIEIPIGVENPTGLVYRVQVGAFSKRIKSSVFKEFNPVSGELISGTSITRYMAGFFNNSDSVVQARQDIRGLGYGDAFVVAYCDGERISFGEARRREASGACVPKGTNEIMMEVALNTAENLGILVSNEVQDVPELTYNQAPGAAEADPIENMKGLFFTVQVGVFNRPVGIEDLNNMPDIITIRLPNGLIRYSSGKFDSVEDAFPRQKTARERGVGGAFITAYYNGKRISIGNARKLLNENGRSILQSEMIKEKPVDIVLTPSDVVRIDTVTNNVTQIIAPMELWEHRVQIVTKKTFDEFPRDVLNRYNAEGSFYYDVKDKRVKSVIYKNADYLPRIWNFRDDLDTVYLPVDQLADTKQEIIGFAFKDSIIPGDFMDWMLRCNYRREIFKTLKGTEVMIFGVDEDDLDAMLERIKLFGIDPKVIIETEVDLELEENK